MPGAEVSAGLRLLASAAGEPGKNIVVITNVPYVPAPAHPWLPWLIGATMLIAAAVVAWQRRASAGLQTPRRLHRILFTALSWGTTAALMHAPSDTGFGGPHWMVRLAFESAALALFAVAVLGALDLVLDALAPRRRPSWLAAAAPLFALVPVAMIGLADLGSIALFGLLPPQQLALAGAVAGLVWWSLLPSRDERLAHVFE